MKQFKKEKSFTIVELLVSIFVIIILLLMALANYRSGQEALTLERAAYKLAQDIRRAQEMAMAAEEFGGQVPKGGYGVYLKKVPPPQKSYLLFADLDDSPGHKSKYDAGSDGLVETIYFESGVKIKEFIGNHLNIVFIPPDPIVSFKDNNLIDLGSTITITICLEKNETKTKTITVNKAGLIDIQ